LFLALSLFAGCASWFEEEDKPPLPGERVTVLAHEQTLVPDPRTQGERIVLPPAQAVPEWPQAGGSAHHAMHHVLLAERPNAAWRASIGSGRSDESPLLASPVVAAGKVFTIDTEHEVRAFAVADGREAWRLDLAEDEDDDDAFVGGLAFAQGRIFATTGFGHVVAIDADTGAEIWRRQVGIPIHGSPTVSGGRVFFVSVENTLHALSAVDGSDLWPPHRAIAEPAGLLGFASPAVDGGVIVAPFTSGELTALRVENGRVLWTDSLASLRRTDELASLADIRARPVIDGGRVYAGSYSGPTAAIDLRTGQRLWDKDIGTLHGPWIAGRLVFMISTAGELVSLSSETGAIRWVTKLPSFEDEEEREDPIVWAGPMLAGERLIIVGSHGVLLIVSPLDGQILASRDLPDGASLPPIAADGQAFILTDDGTLSAYR
jgi:outer membrane protein assembly factor BamB